MRKIRAKAPVDALEIDQLTVNALHRNGIHTLEDLVECTDIDLYHIKNIGQRRVERVSTVLAESGLTLRKVERVSCTCIGVAGQRVPSKGCPVHTQLDTM